MANVLEIIKDDHTKQLSLSRILCLSIVFYCFVSMYGADIPVGWCGLVIALYTANKTSSTYKETQNVS